MSGLQGCRLSVRGPKPSSNGLTRHFLAHIPNGLLVLALSCCARSKAPKENSMETNTRRNFVGKITAVAALLTSAPRLMAQQAAPAAVPAPAGDAPRRS